MTFEEINDDILKIEKDKIPKNFWVLEGYAPLMYKKRDYYSYKTKDDMIKDSIVLQANKGGAQEKMPINLLILASTGWGKTRLTKNILKILYKMGYKILIIEPKSFEFVNMKYKGKGVRLAPEDMNEKLENVVSYTPYFVKEFLDSFLPDRVNSTKFYSSDLRLLNNTDAWIGMGVPLKAAHLIVGEIKKDNISMEDWIDKIRNDDVLHFSTKNAAISSLEGLQSSGFFNKRYKDLDLEKEWKENNIVIINYHNQRNGFMLYDVGLMLQKVMRIGQIESNKGLDKVTKKLIILDDAFFYSGSEATDFNKITNTNLAANNISHLQNNARTWGVNTVLIVQNLNIRNIYSNLIDGCTSKLIGGCENVEYLRGKIPEYAFNLIANTTPEKGPVLYSNDINYVKQWVISSSRTTYDTGMVYDCSLGHSG